MADSDAPNAQGTTHSRSKVASRHPLLTTLARNLRRSCNVSKHDHLLLAVSGGADSVALLTAMHQLACRKNWQLRLTVAHVNHHLRDHDGAAARDAAFVESLTRKLDLRFVQADIHPQESPRCESGQSDSDAPDASDALGAASKQNPPSSERNLEARSRQQRYAALHHLAQQVGAPLVVTAHHADDQLETMLMRLIRGSAARGLAAMAWRRPLHPPQRRSHEPLSGAPDVVLIRPLLDVPSSLLRDWVKAINQDWCEDATNRDVTRWRARLRHDVMPVLRALRPDAATKASHAADHLRSLDQLLQTQARHWLQTHGQFIRRQNPNSELDQHNVPDRPNKPDQRGKPDQRDETAHGAQQTDQAVRDRDVGLKHSPADSRQTCDSPGPSWRVRRAELAQLHPALRDAVIARMAAPGRQLRHDELTRIACAVTDHHTHRRRWSMGCTTIVLSADELITSRCDGWPDGTA